jgi:hypothetical protein
MATARYDTASRPSPTGLRRFHAQYRPATKLTTKPQAKAQTLATAAGPPRWYTT